MACSKDHLAAGLASGAVAYLVWKYVGQHEFQMNHLFLAIGVGGAAGLFADVAEPALHSHHRKFFHSLALGGLGAMAVSSVCTDSTIRPIVRLATLAAGLGHGSHLLLDSLTPRGLPLI